MGRFLILLGIALYLIGLALIALGAGAYAADWPPPPCDAKQSSAVCALILQRNEALDKLANFTGALMDETRAAAALKERGDYWADWAAGATAHDHRLDQHLSQACAWRGVQNQPTAELCKWWRAHK